MRIVIAGGHGKIAMRLERLLTMRGDDVTGIIIGLVICLIVFCRCFFFDIFFVIVGCGAHVGGVIITAARGQK